MAIMTDHLTPEQQANRLPSSPGVYLMKNRDGELLYIGKAINLRSRVKSYFLSDHEDRRLIPLMLKRLHTIDWIATNSEPEALILEANLIRSHKPPFNIDLRDDKHYPYLKITTGETFPRLVVVRRVTDKTSLYFGPYTDARAMRQVMAFARRIFGIRSCNKHLPLPRPARPCINYEMKRCSGACAAHISAQDYQANINQVVKFLNGRRTDLVKELKDTMNVASRHFAYEEAARYRDQITLIEDASRLQRVDLKLNNADCDVFGVYKSGRSVCLTVMGFREGLLMNRRNFVISRQRWDGSEGDREAALLQYYQSSVGELPAEIFLSESIGARPEMVEHWLRQESGRVIHVTIPQRGTKAHLVAMANKNALLHGTVTLLSEPETDIEDLRLACSLERTPRVIDAFDISNLGAQFAVAGMVRFTDGRPDKRQYRRYKIKSVEGQNDFAMMMEVVTRRLARLESENQPFPDLLLIDGGKGQLSAACQALVRFTRPPMIVSIAKQEELLFTPQTEEPIALPASHPARRLVERIRDEVHRWAITYHRTLRGHQFRRSSLEQIPGVGPRLATLLLKEFGSVKRITAATTDQIAAIPGISRRVAESVHAELHKKKPAMPLA